MCMALRPHPPLKTRIFDGRLAEAFHQPVCGPPRVLGAWWAGRARLTAAAGRGAVLSEDEAAGGAPARCRRVPDEWGVQTLAYTHPTATCSGSCAGRG